MSRKLLVWGSIIAVGATTSLLLSNQNTSQSPISITPPSSIDSTPPSKNKKENRLAPLLPSLAKPLTSSAELSLKEPQLKQNISSQPLAIPTITSIKPKQFVPHTSLQKPLPPTTQTIINSGNSSQFVPTETTASSPIKSAPVFTHRSRRIVPPIDYPVLPPELLATPSPIAETPTPNITRESLATPMPIPETPTPSAPLITPTPTEPLITPTLIQPLATPTEIQETPTNSSATPPPIQATPSPL